MGCDIHLVVEKKINGVWKHVWPALVAEPFDVEDDPEGYAHFPGQIVSEEEADSTLC